jgi:hypothetical protein
MDTQPLQQLERCIRQLEADPEMRKGVLIDSILTNETIHWDGIFESLELRGRHKGKKRWRRAVIQDAIRRPFLRGGARKRGVACLSLRPAALPQRLLKAAPWFVDVQELQSFDPREVWDQFCICFPVLAVYRKGWVPSQDVANTPPNLDPVHWDSIWTEWRTSVLVVGETLEWPPAVMDMCTLLVHLSRKLYPTEPWDDWFPEEISHTSVPRAIIPLLRRAACLCYGFHLGGCSPRGVWEAITLPNRLTIG